MNKNIPILILCGILAFACKRQVPINVSQGNSVLESFSTNSETGNEPQGDLRIKAKVIRILDGDTAEVLYEKLPLKVRLQHIDAPEKRGSQPFGNKAKKILSDLCFGQEITLVSEGDFDMGGRIIGEIINEEGINVNMEMVKLGYAWHFKKYSDSPIYDELEKAARKTKVGLWQDANPIAPWNFR